MPDPDALINELSIVEREAARRQADLEDLFRMALADWQSGRGFTDVTGLGELAQRSHELAAELAPESEEVRDRRRRVLEQFCELFIQGSDTDRAALGQHLARSDDLVWALEDYLQHDEPWDEAGILRLLAAASMLAPHTDNRDLLVWLLRVLDEGGHREIDVAEAARRVRARSSDLGRELLDAATRPREPGPQ